MILTDKNYTGEVDSPLCTTINDKLVVSMQSMFYSSNASSIDLSSLDTSKANKSQMFNVSKVNTGYDRTQADANRLHSAYGLIFIVKGISE